MERRGFLKMLVHSAIAAPLMPAAALAVPVRKVVIQQSPIAGFQYYDGDEVFPKLWVDTPLLLVRDSENKHDENAVAIYYMQYQLGYVPKADNTAVAQMLDRVERLSARVVDLAMSRNPWERVRFEVMLDG